MTEAELEATWSESMTLKVRSAVKTFGIFCYQCFYATGNKIVRLVFRDFFGHFVQVKFKIYYPAISNI